MAKPTTASDAASRPAPTSKKASRLDAAEQAAKIVATLAIPIVLAMGGWVIQSTIESSKQEIDRQRISLEYVKLAKEILTSEKESSKEMPKELIKWSWQLIDSVSPRRIDPKDLAKLINDEVKLPPPVSAVPSKSELGSEYQRMFNQMKIPEASLANVDRIVARIESNRARYAAVTEGSSVPWFVVGMLHMIESGGNFSTHLHNGDPLSGRTVHAPSGRPAAGNPPFTWEASAKDALESSRLSQAQEWDIASILWEFERYNGFGYRRRNVPSPYLWGCSDQYQTGKFVADAQFNPDAVSRICGIAPLLKRLIERNVVAAN